MDKMYVPMRFLAPNECPSCKTKSLNLVDIDITIRGIDNSGRLTGSKDGCLYFLKCSKCGKEYDVIKRGEYVRIKNKSFDNSKISCNPFYQ